MPDIRSADIEKIAKLARLDLSQKEQERFALQISRILEYVEKLNEVATDSVEPTNQVTDQVNIQRPDILQAQEETARNKILDNAPEKDETGFRVKTVFQ